MLKKKLNATERYGLTHDEIKAAESYLKFNKTQGVLNDQDALPLYEMYLLGYSFEEIHKNYAQYSYGRIVLTAALNSWTKDREKLAGSIMDRIKARIVRSTVEQVEYLSNMLAVANVESKDEVAKYLSDPKNSPAPSMRIKSFKEYKDVVETLAKVTDFIRSTSLPGNKEEDPPKNIGGRPKKELSKPSDRSDESLILEALTKDE